MKFMQVILSLTFLYGAIFSQKADAWTNCVINHVKKIESKDPAQAFSLVARYNSGDIIGEDKVFSKNGEYYCTHDKKNTVHIGYGSRLVQAKYIWKHTFESKDTNEHKHPYLRVYCGKIEYHYHENGKDKLKTYKWGDKNIKSCENY